MRVRRVGIYETDNRPRRRGAQLDNNNVFEMFHVLRSQLECLPLQHENFVHLTQPTTNQLSGRFNSSVPASSARHPNPAPSPRKGASFRTQ